MNEGGSNYKELYKKSSKKYIFVILIIIGMVLSKHFLMQYLLSQQEESSRLINIAGRQRMLSQKITKDSMLILRDPSNQDYEYYIEDLGVSLKEFSKSHDELINRNNDPVVAHIFKDIDYFYKNITKSGNEILKITNIEREKVNFQKIQDEIEIIKKNEGFFLVRMDDIVSEYELKTATAFNRIQVADNLFMVLITIMFILLFTRLIKPIQLAMETAFWDIHENNENIIKMFNTMRNPFFIIKETGEIILANNQGEKLIQETTEENNIINSIKWLNFDMATIIERIIEENILEGIEGKIKNPKGEEMFFNLSGVVGFYKGCNVIFITINDFTVQKKVEEQMKDMAIRDELTGLYNRRHLDMIIGDEIERAERYEIPLSLFILDLDFFKKINDEWGHPIGDSVLQMVGAVVTKNTRLSDYHFRIGGEEFLVIMPHTDLKGAQKAAEKLRIEIEKVIHPVAGKFTASFGVAERKKGETYHQLYQNADTALYQAKDQGRNQVVVFESGDDESLTLDWKDAWNCGEENIDQQHKELFMLSSKLLETYALFPGKEEVLKHLDDILNHIVEHFKYEEIILTKIKYNELYNHRHIHNDLIKKAYKIRENLNNGLIDISKVFSFLFEEVVVGHMLKEDVKFFPLLKNL